MYEVRGREDLDRTDLLPDALKQLGIEVHEDLEREVLAEIE